MHFWYNANFNSVQKEQVKQDLFDLPLNLLKCKLVWTLEAEGLYP